MSKKKICFIAQFPPPIHGLSKAVDTLYNSRLQEKYEFEKINITDNKKIFLNLLQLIKSDADLFYFTISQTKGGNLRDLIIFKLLEVRGKKCLIHLHGGYYRQLVDYHMPLWQRKANYKAVKKLAGAIVLGKSLKSIFVGMLDNRKIFVVPNCVDDKYVMAQPQFELKQNTLTKRNVKHILFLSNMIRTKGYPVLLELAKEEKLRCDAGAVCKYHFDFCGEFFSEDEEQYFNDYIQKYGLNDYVTYHGVVVGDEKRAFLKKSDFFALPTRYPKEGQPISIIEAMANGLYIITTDHAGIPDLVTNGVNGIVLRKSQQLKLNMLDKAQISQVAKKNREIAQSKYSEIFYIRNMERCFEEVLSK